jgi:hypothetical protein
MLVVFFDHHDLEAIMLVGFFDRHDLEEIMLVGFLDTSCARVINEAGGLGDC